MVTAPLLLWLRQDLRLADNPALEAALASGRPVVPVFILDDEAPGEWRHGGAQRWWLHHSLAALARDIHQRGGRLLLRAGPAEEVLPALVRETDAAAVYWSRRYQPWAIRQDRALKTSLGRQGLEVRSFRAGLIHEPWTVATGKGEPYRVYTPYARAWLALPRDDPGTAAPGEGAFAAVDVASDELDSWRLLPVKPDWAKAFAEVWQPGEAGAHARLGAFLDDGLDGYGEARDRPDQDGSSRLSPHLHFGEIAPWRVLEAALRRDEGRGFPFVRQLIWREFAHHTLYHFPDLADKPLRPAFERFGWRDDRDGLRRWQQGRTGFPLVDAGMRQLWRSGWMHNRVRMIAASFLTKDLLIPWQAGAAWFWDTLLDADLADNSLGWQWCAGTGIDSAPYFRIFNPTSQGQKFDPDGTYVRRWLPELAGLPAAHIHAPAEAPPALLAKAGIRLGETYPLPMLDHAAARLRALEHYRAIGG